MMIELVRADSSDAKELHAMQVKSFKELLEKYQGQGIAQKAIQLCEELHGNGNWELETILQEPRNCHLYEKMGYRQTGKTKVINERLTLTFYEKREEAGRKDSPMREQGADVLIIGNTIVGETLKGSFVLNEDNPLRKELFTLDEIDTMRIQYDIKRVIITHLEEDWGKSYDDYKELEKELNLIQFAYDGLKIQL